MVSIPSILDRTIRNTSRQAKIKIEKRDGLIYSVQSGFEQPLHVSPYPPDTLMAQAYMRMEEDGSIDTLFHEGVPTLSDFLVRFCIERQAILACSYGSELAGFGWFNKVYQIGRLPLCKAEAGIIYFKEHRKLSITRMFGWMMTEWAFDNIKPRDMKLDLICGTTPEPNKAACMYFRALGWNSIGPFPNYTTYPDVEGPVGVYLSSMPRSRWQEVSPFA